MILKIYIFIMKAGSSKLNYISFKSQFIANKRFYKYIQKNIFTKNIFKDMAYLFGFRRYLGLNIFR